MQCVQEKQILPLHPRFMIYTSNKTKEKFKEEIDKFGDAYREDANLETLKAAFAAVKLNPRFKPLNKAEVDVVRKEFSIKIKSQYFQDLIFYVDRFKKLNDESSAIRGSPLELLEISAQMHGATIVRHASSRTTHVIVDPLDKIRVNALKRFFASIPAVKFVKSSFISDCLEQKKLLDSSLYLV